MQTPQKIAVAGATGRLGRHLVDVLRERGIDVVPISRSQGVDVVTGQGLDAALRGSDVIIDASTPATPDEQAAIEFFTAAVRNLHDVGSRAGVQRMITISIIGIDTFANGYVAAKITQERAALDGPIPTRIVRASQFHEFVGQLVEWGTQGEVAYVQEMRTQPVAARSLAEVVANLALSPSDDLSMVEVAGPREEQMVDLANQLVAHQGRDLKIEGVHQDGDPNQAAYDRGDGLPGPAAILVGPTFESWLRDQR
jgi:uncharacterized protein YbjT (DUF2867 family)